MIVTTEAVVLRTRKYRETSTIVSLYTRAFGKISAIAKGARDRKGKFGSALLPMSYVSAVMYKKENRDLQLLSQCDLLESFRALSDDLQRMAPGMMVVELVDIIAHSEEENQPLFRLLVSTLKSINIATKNASLALYFFEMKLLELLGFKPNLHRCAECSSALDEATLASGRKELHLSPAGLVCPSCSARGLGLEPVSAPATRILQRLQELTDVDAATRISMTQKTRNEVAGTLRKYLETHVEGLGRLKAEAVFSSILYKESAR
jgi:DNA repair protein RecO (recombination protein O)